jgi:parallel beta-helix repeat protein
MLHRSSNDCLIEGNQSFGNADSGISIFGCDRTMIRNNLCRSNANAGIRLNVGSADNWIVGNELRQHRYGLNLFEGDDAPEPDDDGGSGTLRCRRNTFTNNLVFDCTSDFVKVVGADSNTFFANVFAGDSPVLRFQNGTNNLLVGNVLPADTSVKLIGAATNRNSVTFQEQPRLAVQLDSFSTATFTNDAGAIFDLDPNSVATRVARRGSSVTLTTADIGSEATVSTRDFFVKVNTAEALVSVPLWEVSGDLRKQWTSRPTSATARPRFTVGDLLPNRTYAISRNGQALAAVASDAYGWVSFADAPGSTNATQYSVTPTKLLPTLPTVSVLATETVCIEGGTNSGRFSIRRIGSIAADLTVGYSVAGLAAPGTDYELLTGSVTIPAGDDSANVRVQPIDDWYHEPPESVQLTLTPDPYYSIDTASAGFEILDNDPPGSLPPLRLVITRVPPTVGQTQSRLAFSWDAVAGKRYRLQFKSTLSTTSWSNVGDTITATNQTVTALQVLGTSKQGFYRVMLLQ